MADKKKFGGKTFTYHYGRIDKRQAKLMAQELRQKGYSARIFHAPEPWGWEVYKRKYSTKSKEKSEKRAVSSATRHILG